LRVRELLTVYKPGVVKCKLCANKNS